MLNALIGREPVVLRAHCHPAPGAGEPPAPYPLRRAFSGCRRPDCEVPRGKATDKAPVSLHLQISQPGLPAPAVSIVADSGPRPLPHHAPIGLAQNHLTPVTEAQVSARFIGQGRGRRSFSAKLPPISHHPDGRPRRGYLRPVLNLSCNVHSPAGRRIRRCNCFVRETLLWLWPLALLGPLL